MKNKIWLLLFVAALNSCNEDDVDGPEVPTVTTTTATNISDSIATSGGNVTGDGGSTVTERGVCWNTTGTPDITGNKISSGSGMGSFAVNLSGLLPNTTYYIRAYATNANGTGYGSQLTFKTGICPSTMTDIDGNVYTVVEINGKCWMQQYLKTSRYKNGIPIPTGLSGSQWNNTVNGAYAVYNDDPANNTTYGKIYNWYAVNTGFLAPAGWHVPSLTEYEALINFLGGPTVAGGAMKTTSGWETPNVGATNSSGFSALPGGYKTSSGSYNNITNLVEIWTSTDAPTFPGNAYMIVLLSSTAGFGGGPIYKDEGGYVRCVKD